MGFYQDTYFRIPSGTSPDALADLVEAVLLPHAEHLYSEGGRVRILYAEGSQWLQAEDFGFMTLKKDLSRPTNDLEASLLASMADDLRVEIVMLTAQSGVGGAYYAHYVDGELRRFLSSVWSDEVNDTAWIELFGSPEPWEESDLSYTVGKKSPLSDYVVRYFLPEYYQLQHYWGAPQSWSIDRPLWNKKW